MSLRSHLTRYSSLALLTGLILAFYSDSTIQQPTAPHKTSSQVVDGDCQLKQSTRQTRVHCNGSYRFKASSNQANINADVSGRGNRILVRTHNASDANTSNVVITQSGNGGSVRITFANNRHQTKFHEEWTLEN